MKSAPTPRLGRALTRRVENVRGPDAESILADDPQPPRKRLRRKKASQGECRSSYWRQALIAQAEHNDSGCARRFVAPDVAEVEVERDERPRFGDGYLEQPVVTDASQLLVSGERHVVSRSPEDLRHQVWDILVQLEGHRGHVASVRRKSGRFGRVRGPRRRPARQRWLPRAAWGTDGESRRGLRRPRGCPGSRTRGCGCRGNAVSRAACPV